MTVHLLSAKSRQFFAASAVFFVVVLTYASVFTFDFINFDDDVYVTQNPYVNSGLSLENIIWAFTQTHGGHWHPLTWISHMLDCEIFGLHAGWQHLVNVLLHACSSVFLLLFARHFFDQLYPAFFVALIFALHPLRLESVAWIAERKDVLSVCFGLLSLNCYMAYRTCKTRLTYFATFVALLLGLLAKPSLVVLPVLFVLIDALYPLKKAGPTISARKMRFVRGEILDKTGFLAIAFIVGCLTVYAQQQGGGLKDFGTYPLTARLANVCVSYLTYFGKLYFPTPSGIFYPFTLYAPGVGVGAGCGLLAISLLFWRLRSQQPALLFGWLWFLIAAAPIVGFIQVGGQAFADRWTYLPHIGLVIGSVSFVCSRNASYRLSRPRHTFGNKAGTIIVLALFVAAMFFLTTKQLPHWRDSESIFRQTLRVSPDNFMAHNNLGAALDEAGKSEAALFHYRAAAHLRPNYPVALNNLGSMRARLGNFQAAQKLFEQALDRNPQFVSARYNMGLIALRSGNFLAALDHWLTILLRDSSSEQTLRSAVNLIKQLSVGQFCNSVQKQQYTYQQLQDLRSKALRWGVEGDLQDLRDRLLEALNCPNLP